MMTEPDTSDARYNYIYRGIVNIITSDQRLSIYTWYCPSSSSSLALSDTSSSSLLICLIVKLIKPPTPPSHVQ